MNTTMSKNNPFFVQFSKNYGIKLPPKTSYFFSLMVMVITQQQYSLKNSCFFKKKIFI